VGVNATLVLMPKAPSYVDDFLRAGKHDVWLTRQFKNVTTKSVIHGADNTTHDLFWLRTGAPDPAHILASPLDRNRVCHGECGVAMQGQTAMRARL
jgi:hypothetical protein